MRSGPRSVIESGNGPALDLMRVSRRAGLRFGVVHNKAELIASSPGACPGDLDQDATVPDYRDGRDKPGDHEWEPPRVLPCYVVHGRRRCRMWGKMRLFNVMACSIEDFARLRKAYWTTNGQKFHPGLDKEHYV